MFGLTRYSRLASLGLDQSSFDHIFFRLDFRKLQIGEDDIEKIVFMRDNCTSRTYIFRYQYQQHYPNRSREGMAARMPALQACGVERCDEDRKAMREGGYRVWSARIQINAEEI